MLFQAFTSWNVTFGIYDFQLHFNLCSFCCRARPVNQKPQNVARLSVGWMPALFMFFLFYFILFLTFKLLWGAIYFLSSCHLTFSNFTVRLSLFWNLILFLTSCKLLQSQQCVYTILLFIQSVQNCI